MSYILYLDIYVSSTSVCLNDLEEFMSHNNVHGLSNISQEISYSPNIYMKLFILLYTDDTIHFSDSPEDIQKQLNV